MSPPPGYAYGAELHAAETNLLCSGTSHFFLGTTAMTVVEANYYAIATAVRRWVLVRFAFLR